MGRFSDTRELQRLPESLAPVSAPSPHGSSTTLERILDAVCLAPVGAPFEESMRWMLASFAEILPGYALALRIVDDRVDAPFVLQMPPADQRPSDPSADDIIMFPAHPHERVVPLTCRPAPSALHCASDDPDLESPNSQIGFVLRWCAEAVNTVIRHADSVRLAASLQAENDQLRGALAQSDKLASLGQLSAGLVHDMSNPLTSIAVYADYLRRKMQAQQADPDDVQRMQRIAEAADVLLGLTRALKAYARPSAALAAPVEVRAVLDQALRFCSHSIESCGIEVRRLDHDDLPPVVGFASQLTQVFVNLITNACEALRPAGGVVTLGVHTDPSRSNVIFTVADSGPGIASEHVSRIFEPFFTTREDAGTGLGLTIVRQIVDKHRGSVSVRSQPGNGCTFTIVLPAATDPTAGS